jgi:uncharacterized protein (TIGR03579 family)
MKSLKDLFMKDWFFFVIAAAICSGVVGSVHMYMVHGVGYLNSLVGGQILRSGDYATAAGYGGGFLIARVLEGPLVGIIDIGGGMMHGVGCGIAGLMYASGLGWMIESFPMALISGAVVGLAIASIVMGVRFLVPAGVQAGGSDIMMGVGHQLASWLGPLFILAALQASIPIGVTGVVGGIAFYVKGRNVIGGVLIGMFIAAFIWPLAL